MTESDCEAQPQEQSAEDHNGDAEILYPRFVDHASQSAQALNDLLDKHLPLGIFSRCSDLRWQFDFEDVEVEIRHDSAGITVHASSAVLPRRHLDPLRQELRGLLSHALSADAWNTLSFGVFLLQSAETASGYLAAWRLSEREAKQLTATKGWDATKVNRWEDVLENPHGVDLLSINDTA